MPPELCVRHANYGLELIDALTGGPLLGASAVTAELVTTPPPAGRKVALDPFLVNRSRWVFEDLQVDVKLTVSSDFYLTATLQTGAGALPSVPSTGNGLLIAVPMTPRAGYPFAANLTRVIGTVHLALSVDPAQPAVSRATLTVTPYYEGAAGPGTPLAGETDEAGQYVIWFQPDTDFDARLPTLVDIEIEADVLVGGISRHVTGELLGHTIVTHQSNGVPTIELS